MFFDVKDTMPFPFNAGLVVGDKGSSTLTPGVFGRAAGTASATCLSWWDSLQMNQVEQLYISVSIYIYIVVYICSLIFLLQSCLI